MLYNKDIWKHCFCFGKRYWYKNIKHIPMYFKSIHHLVKYGYTEYATWSTDYWFIETMKSILKAYRDKHISYPIIVDNYPLKSRLNDDEREIVKLNNRQWDDIINRMIKLLYEMDESDEIYGTPSDYKREYLKRDAAKDEFFELFSKHFWELMGLIIVYKTTILPIYIVV